MRLAILGVGLIGGSVALAARERLGAQVVGWDPSSSALQQALALGALDAAAASAARAVADAEAVFLAAPVGVLPALAAEALAAAGPDCVVTDVGSTKRAVVASLNDPRFVGGHPLAGAENAGVRYARADLFDGAVWYLTPTASTSGVLYERLHRVLGGLGARPAAIDADEHDRVLAAVSHLPHVLANVLVGLATETLRRGDGATTLPATGPSFRDATRVAGAPSGVWSDIYLSNRDALVDAVDAAVERLQTVRSALVGADREAITAWNEHAATARRALRDVQAGGGELHELRASVPNRPGVVAQIALELGRAGVNIADMALYPTEDMSEGVVALWIAGPAAADRAAQLIAGLGLPVARA
ncbi:MAG: prephenate dehydrogenase/arogenate dehydrogenase family protein [Solirubrobacteraceae bacterium]